MVIRFCMWGTIVTRFGCVCQFSYICAHTSRTSHVALVDFIYHKVEHNTLLLYRIYIPDFFFFKFSTKVAYRQVMKTKEPKVRGSGTYLPLYGQSGKQW